MSYESVHSDLTENSKIDLAGNLRHGAWLAMRAIASANAVCRDIGAVRNVNSFSSGAVYAAVIIAGDGDGATVAAR